MRTQFLSIAGLLLLAGMASGCSGSAPGEPATVNVGAEQGETGTESGEAGADSEATGPVVVSEATAQEAISAVIETDFTSPRDEFIRLEEAVYDAQFPDMTEEEYQAFLASDVYQAYMEYYEDAFAAYFTEDEMDDFIRTASMMSVLQRAESSHQTTVQNIVIERSGNENAPNNYSFSFEVVFTDGEGNSTTHQLKGKAIMTEEGKIGRFQYTDPGGLVETINSAY
ncbi:hypothetical protein [Indiicoccus explosivorum]|uniref:hypothetical protein n=1 Tax=Indiicoccus explosivorum TaxID=1917864 RepID=UPI000B4461E2|nr:hypothetical protein [Indiicoccus explosivorum]